LPHWSIWSELNSSARNGDAQAIGDQAVCAPTHK